MTSRMSCAAIAVLFVALTGCRFFGGRVKPDPTPAAAPPRPVVVQTPVLKVEPPGPPPKIETKAPPEVPPAVARIPTPPAPKPKRRQPRKAVTATGTVQAPPVQPVKDLPAPPTPVETAPIAPPPINVPKLGEVLSDDQKNQLLKICDESLGRAREALVQLSGVTMSADQKQSMSRVKVFIYQAEQAKPRDPQTAKQLAERADLLSRDLVRTAR